MVKLLISYIEDVLVIVSGSSLCRKPLMNVLDNLFLKRGWGVKAPEAIFLEALIHHGNDSLDSQKANQ